MLALLTVGTLSSSASALVTELPPYEASNASMNRRFDEVYYIQSHNTYDTDASLKSWLNAGFRSVEIDVIDRGDWEDNDLGPYVSHGSEPGDKRCDSDNGDDRLGHCLRDIIQWIDANPGEPPIVLLVDMKAAWDPMNAWWGDEVAMLDEWIRSFAGDYMYRYDELYDHLQEQEQGSGNPRALLREHGWPTLNALSGKIIIGLTGGIDSFKNQNMAVALGLLASHYDRYPATFMCPNVETGPDAVSVNGTINGMTNDLSRYFLCGNLKSQDHYQEIANLAAANKQLIHLWGRHVFDNPEFPYNYIAIAHGAQLIGQDLDTPSDRDNPNHIPLVGVRRSLPGYFRVQSSLFPDMCMNVEGSYENGADIQQEECDNSSDGLFVYTAEGQLRPKGNNRYCVDIEGGTAGNGKKLHLWNCDGGDSEKWIIDRDGRFRSYENRTYCIESSAFGGGEIDWVLRSCSSSATQKLVLDGVSDWTPSVH